MTTQALSAIKKQIKKLLEAGNSNPFVAKQLQLPLSRVKQLRKEIVEDKMDWNKKEKILDPHHQTIKNLKNDWDVTAIHSQLLAMNIKVSYTTVARFVTQINKTEKMSKIITEPGHEAKIFLIRVGIFDYLGKKQRIWIFMMKLSYSKYQYCEGLAGVDFENFLECNKNAFAFFNGVPRLIKVNKTSAFNLNESDLNEQYVQFLEDHGSRLFFKSKRNCFIDCPTEVRNVKEQLLYPMMHKIYDRFLKNLKHWSTFKVNLRIHPSTKKVIEKEFIKNEKPKMLPFNAKKITNIKKH